MKIIPGTILQSEALADDDYFNDTQLIINETDAKGTTGFIFNKLFPRSLDELTEFSHSKGFPIYEGGPAEQEKLFFIHQRPDLIEGGTLISGNIYFGGNFKKVMALINVDIISEADIKLFIGYCGWDKGQLQAEIKDGSWAMSEGEIFH